ncbi:MAG: hypothetical protein AAFW89_04175 [Bacteroidota bacterium]
MRISTFFVLFTGLLLLTACTNSYMVHQQPKPVLNESLFPADQGLMSQADINRILDSQIAIPDHQNIAVFRYPDQDYRSLNTVYGNQYWYNESYMKQQQAYMDTLSSVLSSSNKIKGVRVIPSMLEPAKRDVPHLRQTSVRLHAPLLLVFRMESDLYQNYKFLKGSKLKAFSTIEMVLLDVRTGIIPFSIIVTEDVETRKTDQDLNGDLAKQRAIATAAKQAIGVSTQKLVEFLESQDYFSSVK